MTETQLIASGRLDKLEGLVEDIREYAGEVFDEEDYTLMSYSIARSMSSLLELEKLAQGTPGRPRGVHRGTYGARSAWRSLRSSTGPVLTLRKRVN